MVTAKSVEEQLKRIRFKRGWNAAETNELAEILLPDEEIFECVNGWYEGGFALLCATNVRVLLIDKKPFKYLNVEDCRFDTINQIDYSHRMMNASICITAGLKDLAFKSYNQPRLRKLISHVQHRMAEIKQIEQNLRSRTLEAQPGEVEALDYPLRPTASLEVAPKTNVNPVPLEKSLVSEPTFAVQNVSSNDLYLDGVNEIFGKYRHAVARTLPNIDLRPKSDVGAIATDTKAEGGLDPLKIACSKFPVIFVHKKLRSASSSVLFT